MTDINYENESMFGGDEFVFTEYNNPVTGERSIVGGGYKVNSFFLQGGLPAMTTHNSPEQSGGKVSSPFENLAVPAGLFYINQKISKKDLDKEQTTHYYKQHDTISDDMIDKLFGLIAVDKKKQRKTRKYVGNPDKKKTRKHH
jgi:hypothetical protein